MITSKLKESKELPLSRKISQILNNHINTTPKKLDLDILFFASFHDLSNQFVAHLHTHRIDAQNIVKNYNKLTKNPLITKM